eukprot:1392105-Amorphochlora_amoeboformis.AAC.1
MLFDIRGYCRLAQHTMRCKRIGESVVAGIAGHSPVHRDKDVQIRYHVADTVVRVSIGTVDIPELNRTHTLLALEDNNKLGYYNLHTPARKP